jgi:hypothetical protein
LRRLVRWRGKCRRDAASRRRGALRISSGLRLHGIRLARRKTAGASRRVLIPIRFCAPWRSPALPWKARRVMIDRKACYRSFSNIL